MGRCVGCLERVGGCPDAHRDSDCCQVGKEKLLAPRHLGPVTTILYGTVPIDSKLNSGQETQLYDDQKTR